MFLYLYWMNSEQSKLKIFASYYLVTNWKNEIVAIPTILGKDFKSLRTKFILTSHIM